MAFFEPLPLTFIAIIAIIVIVFLIKSLIKFALIVGAIGLVIYLLLGINVLAKIRGGLVPG